MSKYAFHPELAQFEPKIGLLRFEGSKTVESSASYGYKVLETVVRGLTPANAMLRHNRAILAALKSAIYELEKQGVIGIAGESALMLPLQEAARAMTTLPVFLSSLLQVALLIPAHGKDQTFVVFTQYPSEVLAKRSMLLKDCGVHCKEQHIVIEQIPGNADPDAVVQRFRALRGRDPKLAGIIMDSGDFIPHADKLRAMTTFPVFDLVTLLDFFGSACSDNPYFGTSYKGLQGIDGLVTKAQRRLFSPYENLKQCLLTNVDKDAKVGVLRIDYSYPPIPGDIACEASYGYKVVFRQVKGLTFDKCQNAVLDSAIQISLQNAVKELEAEGVVAITGDCGFLMAYQPYVRWLTETPVVLSSILQAPMLAVANGPNAKFAIFTANSGTFDKRKLLTQSGMKVDPSQWVVVGLQELPGFEAVALGQKVPAKKVQSGILACVKDLQRREPNLCGILLECTELPHYADAIRAQTKLPVVDAITLVDFFQNSCTAVPSFSKKVLQAVQGVVDSPVLLGRVAQTVPGKKTAIQVHAPPKQNCSCNIQ